VLPAKLLFPAYTAVIECWPTDRLVILRLAVPVLRVAVPSVTPPSMNVTDPSGVPAPGDTALTVAVIVMFCLVLDGFFDEVRDVNVLALLTICVKAGDDVLPPKLPSPPYTAVIE
jgi:hypothetical protein